jgi:hypothetical protein
MSTLLDILDRRITEKRQAAKDLDARFPNLRIVPKGIVAELEAVRAELAAELEKVCSTNNEQPSTVNSSTTLQFTAEDFRNYCIKNPGAPHDVCIAEVANAKLAAVLEKSPVVFGHATIENEEVKAIAFEWTVGIAPNAGITHSARLIDIQEIKQHAGK